MTSPILKLAPNQAHTWVNCAASPRFSEGLPREPQTDQQAEGITAAGIINHILAGRAQRAQDFIGQPYVDAAMIKICQDYVDHVRKRGGQIFTETTVSFDAPGVTPGVLDVSSFISEKGILYVEEFKYGRRTVEVFGNEQLLIYAAWMYDKISQQGWPIKVIQLSVYQPRSFHHHGVYRKWVISPNELFEHVRQIKEAAAACQQPDSIATPGDWCADCRANTQCQAIAQTGYAIMDTVTSRNARQMDAAELSRELDFFEWAEDIFDARKKAIRAEAMERDKRENIPNWTTETGRGMRKWKVDAGRVNIETGLDPYERKLATPAEMERRGANVETIKRLTEKSTTARRLVRRSPEDVERIFNQGRAT